MSPAPRTASADGSARPSSAGSVGSVGAASIANAKTPTPPVQSAAPSPAPASASPAPSPAPGSGPATPAKTEPEGTKSSDSPLPRPPSCVPSYPVHKLKKAWLQRHSGEDGTEDTAGTVGSGSSFTLPLKIATQQTNGDSATSTQQTSTTTTSNTTSSTNSGSATPSGGTSLPSAVHSIHNIGSMAVNSISKPKSTAKAGRKPAVKEAVNGHAANADEDSSNSEPERKPPPKRKPPKVILIIWD